MVLADHEYLHQGRQRRKLQNELDRRADNIAIVVAQFCLSVPHSASKGAVINALDVILNTGDYRDPGEAFTLGQEVHVAVEHLAVNVWGVYSKKGKNS